MTEIKKIRCLVVDDEPLAREVLLRYIQRVPTLELVAECDHAMQAIIELQKQEVDLMFVDIQMPEMLGTEMIKVLKNPPQVILTTAYPNYALESYELDVVDYLLKPIQFERFLKAVNKMFQAPTTLSTVSSEKETTIADNYLYFRVDRRTTKVMLEDILYVEGMKNYVKIVCKNGLVVTKNSMNTIEAMLPERQFVRVHRSFIVSKGNIKSFTGEIVEINKVEIPIGKLFKNNFLKVIAE